MLGRKEKNNSPITNKILEKALASQSKTILKAVDFGFQNIKKEIKEVKIDIKDLKQKTGKILEQQDDFVKRLTDLEDENTASTESYKRHDEKIEEHGERILALEIKS